MGSNPIDALLLFEDMIKYFFLIIFFLVSGLWFSVAQQPTTPLATTPPATTAQLDDAIQCTPEQMTNGTCTFHVNKVLGIKSSSIDENITNDPTTFIQDLFLGATYFIGTLVTLALLWSAYQYIFWGTSGNEKKAEDGKKGIKYSIIWLLLVLFSYTIVRLIQFLANARS